MPKRSSQRWRARGEDLSDADVLVVAQKIVSKAAGRTSRLGDVQAGEEAVRIARATARDAAAVQLILDESSEVLRATPAAIIARHRTGHVLANAGIDASNVSGGDAGYRAALARGPGCQRLRDPRRTPRPHRCADRLW